MRLLLTLAVAFFVLKMVALALRGGPRTATGLAAFLFVWPGVIPDYFRERKPARDIDPVRFLAAWARMALGGVSILIMAVYAPRIPERLLGLAGTAALLLTIHLGIGDLLPWLLRWAGFDVPLLFDRPWAAASLADFWSRRWNLAFVDMNRRLFLRPLYGHLGRRGARLFLFALSGALHEVAISFPAGDGWGLPFGYFLLQGVLVAAEERFRIANRAWVWLCLMAPAPWLFHEPFRRAVIVPLCYWLHSLIAQRTWDWYLSRAIYAAAIGHLLVLVASVQVPPASAGKTIFRSSHGLIKRCFGCTGFTSCSASLASRRLAGACTTPFLPATWPRVGWRASLPRSGHCGCCSTCSGTIIATGREAMRW